MSHVTVASAARWGKAFWYDLAERVGSTATYALITLLAATQTTTMSLERLWPVVGLPVALSFLKGLGANFKDANSGASLLDSPPGPVLDDEGGAVDVGLILLIAVLVVLVLLVLPPGVFR